MSDLKLHKLDLKYTNLWENISKQNENNYISLYVIIL